MWTQIAPWFVLSFFVYGGLGLVFSIAFVLLALRRIDPAAQNPSWGLRLLLLPGCAAFWPLLLRRWSKSLPPPTEINAHRTAAAKTTPEVTL